MLDYYLIFLNDQKWFEKFQVLVQINNNDVLSQLSLCNLNFLTIIFTYLLRKG